MERAEESSSTTSAALPPERIQMRRKPCLLRSTWPEKNEDDKFLTLNENGIFIDRGEVRRRIRAVPLSKLLGLDEDEYRRELGELNNDNGDDSNSNRRRNGTKGEEKTKKETTERKKEEEAMLLDSLLGDDDDDDDDD
jgi:hypothetical protein